MFSRLKLFYRNIIWKKNNKYNYTSIGTFFPFDNVKVGKYTYGTLNVLCFNDKYTLEIGSFCSIASNVTFCLSSDHPTDRITTYPIYNKLLKCGDDAVSKGNIYIGDDVWIGTNSTILSGVTIGKGAIIAAGAVVSKDVPPFSIVGGVPSEVIKYRFSDDLISELMDFDYNNINESFVGDNIELFTKPLDINTIKTIKELCQY